MLMRMERLRSFDKLWRQANLDYYQTQKNRRKKEEPIVASLETA